MASHYTTAKAEQAIANPESMFPMASDFLPTSQQWLASLALLLVPIFLFLLKQKMTGQKGAKHPPGPLGLPIIGSLHKLGSNPHDSLFKLSQIYGPAMMLKLGSIPTLVVSNAEYAKEILQTHDAIFCSRPRCPGPLKLSYGFLDVAFAPSSHYRTEMRKLFSFELLKAKREQSLWAAREDEIDKMIRNISANAGKEINLNDFIFTVADGVVGQVAFGKSYGAQQFNGQKFSDVLDEVMNVLDSFTAEDFFPSVGRYIDLVTGLRRKLEKRFKDLDGYFTMVLEEHLDPKRPKPVVEDLVDVLIKLMKDGVGEFVLTKEHIKSILMDTFVGGIDTSSVGMVWAMSEIFMNPRILKKAQVEVRDVVGGKRRVEESDMKKLKYLKNIVKETLRMHPPAPLLLPHEAMRHCKIGTEGYDILPQTRVIINAWAVGRDPKSWENPNVFYPERFENTEIDFKGGNFQLIPFGSGRRICPGLAMGATTVTFTIANLLYCFDWQLPDGIARDDICMEEEGGVTMHKKTPLILKPIIYNGKL